MEETLTKKVEENVNEEQQISSEFSFDSEVSKQFTAKTNISSFTNERSSLNVVIDAGASHTRSLPIREGGKISQKDLQIVDSKYAIVDINEDLNVYKINSDLIEDNGEYIILETSESPYIETSWFKDPVRVIKGNLIEKLGKAPDSINNQVDKSDDIGIFINILTSIANLGLKYKTLNLQVKLGFSVPPKERYSSSERLQKLIQTLAGHYKIDMPRFNYTCNIFLEKDDVFVEAEGELPYIYFTTVGKGARERYEEFKDKLVTVQDLGSSTFNLSLVNNGSIQSGVSFTAKFGGENLVSKLYSILSRSLSQPITFAQARQAVETGYIHSGSEKIAIGAELTQAKIEIADLLEREYITFLQIAGLHSNAIYGHLFVGRGMLETGEIIEGNPTPNYSPSIAHILTERYRKMSPNTKSIILSNPGMANLLGLASLMRIQWKL